MREFETGATRDQDKAFDPEGFLSPLVIERFCQYMEKHRTQADGNLRPSDNWQKGMPLDVYMKSLTRHFYALWYTHRYGETTDRPSLEESLCACFFNIQGYLFELLTESKTKLRPKNCDLPICPTYPSPKEN